MLNTSLVMAVSQVTIFPLAGIITDMQPLLNLTSAQNLDHSLIEKYALSERSLIDNAAMGVFKLSKPFIHGRTLVMVGPGNNGSDGIALASILAAEGFDISVFYLYERGNDENMRRRRELPESVRIVSSAHGFDTVFDALFGFSFKGEADDATRTAVSGCCDAGTVIAVDVPSASLVRADYTVSLMTLKSILYEPLLRKIAPDEEEYAEAVRMLKFLRFFRTIEDDSIIVNNSIIREFIGGSIFVD